MESFLSNQAIMLSQVLILIALLMMVGFAIYHTVMALISDPKEAIKSIAGVAVFAVVLFVLWSVASGAKEGIFAGSKYKHITEGVMKMVAGGIFSALLMIAGAFILAVVMEIVNAFK